MLYIIILYYVIIILYTIQGFFPSIFLNKISEYKEKLILLILN